MLSSVAVACALLLWGDTSPSPASPPVLLPRSSIAAVLAHRGELGLTDAEVRQLEERDEALQKQLAEIREQGTASAHAGAGAGRTGARSSLPSSDTAQPLSPTAAALPQGMGAGGYRGGRGGGGRSGGRSAPAAQDPGAWAKALQSKLDDADTSAWLSAEEVLAESRREKAREVAEKHREALADQRDVVRAGR
jgi:hypothetical protein